MKHWTALLLLLASWIERWRTQVQQQEAQEERDLSENNPNAWFDTEFNAGGGVQQYVPPDAGRTDQTNAD